MIEPPVPVPTAGRPIRRRRSAFWKLLGVALMASAVLLGTAIPAAAAELMRVTFVRHAQSAGNASGLIDTSTPGPDLTPLGQQQAEASKDRLAVNNYDAIYSSTMVRTQQTAAPMSERLRLPVQVLPGLQEIEAGIYEGTPENEAFGGYLQAPLRWIGLIPTPPPGDPLDARIPGSIDGHEFDTRVDGALETMYNNGDRNAVVYSHGGTTMFWTIMNAKNLTTEQKIQLLTRTPLHNTDYVVLEGNPEDGWTLVDWNGQRFTPEPTLESEVQLHARTLQRQLAAAAKLITDAAATGDIATLMNAIRQSVADTTFSVQKFTNALQHEITERLANLTPPAPAVPSSPEAHTVQLASQTTSSTVVSPSATDMMKALTKPVADPATTETDSQRQADAATVQATDPATVEATVQETDPASTQADSATTVADSATTGADPATTEADPATTGTDSQRQAAQATDQATEPSTKGAASNGATDLKNGNMAVPGKVGTTSTRAEERASQAVNGASDRGAASDKQSGGVAVKVADTDGEAGKASAGAQAGGGDTAGSTGGDTAGGSAGGTGGSDS